MTFTPGKEKLVAIRVGMRTHHYPAHDVRLMLEALEALRSRALPTSYRSIDLLRDALKEAI